MESIFRDHVMSIPNMLTVLRMLLLPVIVWRFRIGDLFGAMLVYMASMLTDVFDGYAARRLGQITSLGKLLDPLADKLSLLTLVWLFASDGQIPVWMLYLLFAKELILVLGSAVALCCGIVVYALPIGKVTTLMFVSSVICRFLRFRSMADLLFGGSVLLSFAAVIWYGIVLLDRLKAQDAARAKST